MSSSKQIKHSVSYLPFINILFIILFSGCTFAGNPGSNKPFFFIQMSDPQLGFYPDSLAKEIAEYERAVADINELKPDFVVITGDLVNKAGNKRQLAEFQRITSMINKDIPVYLVPGNHDVGDFPTQKSIDFYKSIYGYDRFFFKHKGSLFIGFNSSVISSKTPKLEGEQYQWLKKELKKGKNADHIFLFCHIPLFIHKSDEPDQYYDSEKTERKNFEKPEREKYLNLFKKFHVSAVFAGHLHQNALGRDGNLKMITTGALGEPLGMDPPGFRIIKVNGPGVDYSYYSLDSVPENMNMLQ